MASHREKHWYEDTDVPEDAEAIYKKMRQQWLKLKARSDEVRQQRGAGLRGPHTGQEQDGLAHVNHSCMLSCTTGDGFFHV